LSSILRFLKSGNEVKNDEEEHCVKNY